MASISKKICLVGDFSVGKTSLIRRFVDRQFSDQYLSTVGVKISRKDVELNLPEKKDVKIQLLVWDLEGSTKFKGIAPTYLQGASGVIIVADVTRDETIEHLQDHIDLFLSVNPKGSIICAFNKSDLVDPDKLQIMLQNFNCSGKEKLIAIYSTSAKTGAHVDEMFTKMAETIMLH